MDSELINAYYSEREPMSRLRLLEQSIQAGEEPEANEIRRRLWEIRYKEKSGGDPKSRADGYLGLWMTMEFNRHAGSRFFGAKSARKTIRKELDRLRFPEFQNGSDLERELLYRECCHLIKIYIELSADDRAYNSYFGGLIGMKKENAKNKLQSDVFQTAIQAVKELGLQEELGLISRAAKEVYRIKFPGEETLEEKEERNAR